MKHLKEIFKKLFFSALRHSGYLTLYRKLMQRRRATIILFHEMDTEQAQLVYHVLSRYYQFVSLDSLVEALETEAWESIPDYAMVITLDDGRRSNLAASAFAENGVKAVNFVSSSPERLDGYKFIAENEIKRLAKLFDIQSHTHSHLDLTQLSKSEQFEEVKLNIEFLKNQLGRPVDYVAFPYGKYNSDSLEVCKELGVRANLTVNSGFVESSSNIYELKRICLPNRFSENELLVKASGIWNSLFRDNL